MSRILVTGADGFLVKEVIGILKKNNFEFVGVSRKNTRENYLFCDLSTPNDEFGDISLGSRQITEKIIFSSIFPAYTNKFKIIFLKYAYNFFYQKTISTSH
jgi:dTDP-4-dehydrorhamnose reductase